MKKLLIVFIAVLISFHCSSQGTNVKLESVVKMVNDKEPGKPFTLDITVLDIDSRRPVPNVEVFAYHTNYKGDYENDPKTGIARIHGTALSDEKGAIRFITIYPRGYNDSPTGEHIHFRIKANGYSGGGTDLSFWDYQRKQLDYKNPIVTKVYLTKLEEKDGKLAGTAIIYVKKR
jgi:protocatechuate 3,4-dioxygenase beta subunit